MGKFLKDLFRKFSAHFVASFSGRNLVWHGLAIVVTYFLVASGADWWIFAHTRSPLIWTIAFPAVILGAILPTGGLFALYFWGVVIRSVRTRILALRLGHTAIMAWFISSLYKALTGRISPEHASLFAGDISHGFRLGLLRGGILWGWPSSHTTVAFAMAFMLVALYPRSRLIRYLAPLYALYIGLGVSITVHWFSEFAAGAIIGTVIGLTMGRAFRRSRI